METLKILKAKIRVKNDVPKGFFVTVANVDMGSLKFQNKCLCHKLAKFEHNRINRKNKMFSFWSKKRHLFLTKRRRHF